MKTALDYLIYLEDAKGTNHHENIGVLASLAGPVVDKYYFSNPAMKWLDNWYGEAIYTYGLKFFYFQYVADVDMERFA
ncbi:MAG: hypothetical protein FWE82_10270 [Defluviitaleaceae bacterium]|nr:hypothetical protein [Defluviitaleaceae bacterium]